MKKYLLLVATIVVLSGCGATGMENFGNEETKAEREISTSIDFTEQELRQKYQVKNIMKTILQ